jgi:hypothetical protein
MQRRLGRSLSRSEQQSAEPRMLKLVGVLLCRYDELGCDHQADVIVFNCAPAVAEVK